MENLDTLKNTLRNDRQKMIELQKLLTSVPATAPESGGDGESAKCAALEKWLCAAGFSSSQMKHYDAPDERESTTDSCSGFCHYTHHQWFISLPFMAAIRLKKLKNHPIWALRFFDSKKIL